MELPTEYSKENREWDTQSRNNDTTLEAIKILKRGKAAGNDGITTDIVKNMAANGTDILKILFNKKCNEQKIPEDWKVGILSYVVKIRENKECKHVLCSLEYERMKELSII